MNKPGFYFFELKNDYGTIIALLRPNGFVEKIYIGDHHILKLCLLDDAWYEADNRNLKDWEYIGL